MQFVRTCGSDRNRREAALPEGYDRIWLNARLATMAGPGFGVQEAGAVAARGGRIAFVGTMAELPSGWDAVERIDCGGRWITPGLVDCHTHLVYAGDRAGEFEQRLNGATYAEIAAAGGGILSTVRATRAADEAELTRQSLPRLDALMRGGVTTVEIKSGYGLEAASEARQLRVARTLGQIRPISVTTTCLAAHALPPEFAGDKPGYTRHVAEVILPAIATEGLADAVDVFCDAVGFSAEETRPVLEAAQRLGLPVKLHADQLANVQAAALAARYRALSADHLEQMDEAGAIALAEAGTVAVLLPGAFYFLRETHLPPVALLRRHGVPIALSTDCNPGSSPVTSLPLVLNMAATLFRLTVEECLLGATRHAARALGLQDEVGTLERGKWCDLAIWEIERPAELVYRIGDAPLHQRVWHGTP
jgi:imidazolonepropionase